jgi:hypothetical protein
MDGLLVRSKLVENSCVGLTMDHFLQMMTYMYEYTDAVIFKDACEYTCKGKCKFNPWERSQIEELLY